MADKRTIVNLTRNEIARLIETLGDRLEDWELWQKLHNAFMRTSDGNHG